jgi:hypothetical protein
MFTNAFAGSTKKPTDAQLTATLGPSRPVWDQLLTDLAEQHGISGHEWKSYSSKARWSCRVTRKGRTVANSKSQPGSRRKSQARPPAKEPADLEPFPSHASGRTFERLDNREEALDVAIIDRKLAKRVFGEENPLGADLLVDHFNEKTFSLERLPVRIVGVVDNVRSASLAAEGRETIYVPYVFNSFLPLTYVVRTAADPASLITRIRAEAAAMDPDVPIAELSTLASYVSSAMSQTRFLLALIGAFAALALGLASLGLYGVISYSTKQRTREIGVRVAFGATERDVVRLILGQGLVLALAGIGLGDVGEPGLLTAA